MADLEALNTYVNLEMPNRLSTLATTTDDRFLKTGPLPRVMVEVTKQAAMSDLATGPHTADLSFVFNHASDRKFLIQNNGAGDLIFDLGTDSRIEGNDLRIEAAGVLRLASDDGSTLELGPASGGGIVKINLDTTLTMRDVDIVSPSVGNLSITATLFKVVGAGEFTGDLVLTETAGVSKKLKLGLDTNPVSLHKSAADELTIIAAAIKATSVLTLTGQLLVDGVRIDGTAIDCPTAADDLSLLGGTTGQVLIGRDGDFDLFGSVKRRIGPAQALKATLGSATLPFAEAFIHGLLEASVVGVRGAFDADTYSATPTDGELDAAFGQPAALGAGFTATIRKTDATEYIRHVVVTDEDKWAYSAAYTEL